MKVVFACPSYRRPKCITARYIPTVHVYVDPSEAEEYRRANETGVIVECAPGVQGNLPRVRNHILDREFDDGADVVVMMDDDVSSVSTWHVDDDTGFGYVRNRLNAKQLEKFVEQHAELCKAWGVRDVRVELQPGQEAVPAFQAVFHAQMRGWAVHGVR